MDLRHDERASCGAKGGPIEESFVNHALEILNGRKKTCRNDHNARSHVQVDRENVSPLEKTSESSARVYAGDCAQLGCTTAPSYGTSGSKKRKFCKRHATEGMVNLASKRCGEFGCFKQASYGVKGTTKREFCVQHARAGMVNVHWKRCSEPGCGMQASHSVDNTRRKTVCGRHQYRTIMAATAKALSEQHRGGCRQSVATERDQSDQHGTTMAAAALEQQRGPAGGCRHSVIDGRDQSACCRIERDVAHILLELERYPTGFDQKKA